MDRAIKQAVSYDMQMNRLRINGYQLAPEMIGEWTVDVKVFMFPEHSENVSY